jgi:hypothetical protein
MVKEEGLARQINNVSRPWVTHEVVMDTAFARTTLLIKEVNHFCSFA